MSSSAQVRNQLPGALPGHTGCSAATGNTTAWFPWGHQCGLCSTVQLIHGSLYLSCISSELLGGVEDLAFHSFTHSLILHSSAMAFVYSVPILWASTLLSSTNIQFRLFISEFLLTHSCELTARVSVQFCISTSPDLSSRFGYLTLTWLIPEKPGGMRQEAETDKDEGGSASEEPVWGCGQSGFAFECKFVLPWHYPQRGWEGVPGPVAPWRRPHDRFPWCSARSRVTSGCPSGFAPITATHSPEMLSGFGVLWI